VVSRDFTTRSIILDISSPSPWPWRLGLEAHVLVNITALHQCLYLDRISFGQDFLLSTYNMHKRAKLVRSFCLLCDFLADNFQSIEFVSRLYLFGYVSSELSDWSVDFIKPNPATVASEEFFFAPVVFLH